MNAFYVEHMRRHAMAIRYLPPANKKPSAHQLCNKLVMQLDASNSPCYQAPARIPSVPLLPCCDQDAAASTPTEMDKDGGIHRKCTE